ncbi:MAG TPA: S26 family signal peptidase [Pirellulaceae bacterium]|nr:S26 family signal peptidase [Pirellulaceae bacterium]
MTTHSYHRDDPSPLSLFETLRSAGVRETVESILVAVMLALLFKAFEAEAFVIPTGSMAPTLQGSHKDVACDQCGFRYRVSASTENPDASRRGEVIETCCPYCRYARPIREERDANDGTFSGDRILVSKFSYDIADPQRWDVTVFRFPENAKQPFIKRLIGLPNEELKLQHGDLFVRPMPADGSIDVDAEFRIARKPPKKLLAMLQPVDDSRFVAPALRAAGWPSRWQQWGVPAEERVWSVIDEPGTPLRYRGVGGNELAWLRYRHLVPRRRDWLELADGKLPTRIGSAIGEAITDYYEYDDGVEVVNQQGRIDYSTAETLHEKARRGLHWVGDLAVEAELEIASASSGSIALDLVEGGIHFRCEIDLATGEAVVSVDDPAIRFEGPDGQELPAGAVLRGKTSLAGGGRHRVRYANCDDRIDLWIDDRLVAFDLPGTYRRSGSVFPRWSTEDPADGEPIGIGVKGTELQITRLAILRDVYYISVTTGQISPPMDYRGANPSEVRGLLDDPRAWSTPKGLQLFERRDAMPAVFGLGDDQFFLLGDNSPASHDARMWRQKFATRDDLVGKALFVYWPHSWNGPIPYLPNFPRMGFIR